MRSGERRHPEGPPVDSRAMRVHLIDGTYELFRHYFVLPSRLTPAGIEVAAARGVVESVLRMLEDGATHIAVATDHTVESFRNDLWPDYKTGAGIEPELLGQFPLLEEGLEALGVVVWPMTEYEADDALAAGAAMAAADQRVEQVLICTPDKDLAQCVVDEHVVQFDRRKRQLIDRAGVIEKFGVPPESIPDYLALVGDTADGFPGLKGWGAKSSATVLAEYGHIEALPSNVETWAAKPRGAARLSETLEANRELAILFRRIATVVREAPVSSTVDELRWTGPTSDWTRVCGDFGAPGMLDRAAVLAGQRGGH